MKKTYRDLTIAPFSYLSPSLTNISTITLIVLLPQIFLLLITKSFSSIFILLTTTLASVTAEFTSNKIRRISTLFDLTAVVQGLFIGFFLPQGYPLIPIFIITYLSLLFVKYIFGGNAKSWINPVSYTVIIIYFLGISFFPDFLISKEYLETGNPGLLIFQNNDIPVLPIDDSITFWLNTHFFTHLGIEIPNGYISLFWDSQAIIPAFRFNLLTLLSSIILFSFNMINWIIPTVFLFSYGLLLRLFSQTPFTGLIGQGDILLGFFTSGIFFTSFLIIDFYGTSPLSMIGKIIYGLIAGIIAFLIIGCGTSPIGAMFTVLLTNILSPSIQYFEEIIYENWINKTIRNKNIWQN